MLTIWLKTFNACGIWSWLLLGILLEIIDMRSCTYTRLRALVLSIQDLEYTHFHCIDIPEITALTLR